MSNSIRRRLDIGRVPSCVKVLTNDRFYTIDYIICGLSRVSNHYLHMYDTRIR